MNRQASFVAAYVLLASASALPSYALSHAAVTDFPREPAAWQNPETTNSPSERLERQVLLAKSLAGRHAYAEAAAALESTAGDLAVTELPDWPDTLYALARYQALAGETDKALVTLKTAVDVGATPMANDVVREPDLVSLHGRGGFKASIARLEKEEAVWRDSPVLATGYRPVLSDAEKAAGLAKIWSEARFNFPFFGRLTDIDWDAEYMAYLPQALAAKTTEDYYRVLARFMATLKNGHSRVVAPKELSGRLYGVVPLSTRLIGGKIVVTAVAEDDPSTRSIRPGDEIVAIDGREAIAYAKAEIEPTVFGFTPQDRDVWTYGYDLLRGPVGKPLRLVFRRDGKTFAARAHRRGSRGMMNGYAPEIPTSATFKMLPGNVAYLRICEFIDDAAFETVRDHFAEISKAGGLVIDVRSNGGGNDANGMKILQVLADKSFAGPNWRSRDYKAAFRSWRGRQGWFRGNNGVYQPDPTMHYAGPVAVLVGPKTYSAAEDFTVAFDAMKRGTLIGEKTGGSTGNPFQFSLPGGGMAMICTIDDTYPDGRAFDGVGIRPEIEVAPAVADIRSGRDPALERAMEVVTNVPAP